MLTSPKKFEGYVRGTANYTWRTRCLKCDTIWYLQDNDTNGLGDCNITDEDYKFREILK